MSHITRIHIIHMKMYATRCNHARHIIQTCVTQMNESCHGTPKKIGHSKTKKIVHVSVVAWIGVLVGQCVRRHFTHMNMCMCEYVCSTLQLRAAHNTDLYPCVWHVNVWYDSFICVTQVCIMSRTSLQRVAYVFMCVTCISCVRHVYVWHNPFICPCWICRKMDAARCSHNTLLCHIYEWVMAHVYMSHTLICVQHAATTCGS